ncbi:MAG: DNA-binding transcriptional LysR family regulator [Hyphomicrobiaceae bacterium]|jgi:DNA-binding transcriptional LysR family regulator
MNHMNLKQLRYFVVTAEERNVTQAAVRLKLTQPALSRQLRSLESSLGLQLIKPHGRGITITPEGQSLLRSCRDILARTKALQDEALALVGEPKVDIEIIAATQTVESFLALALRDFIDQFPETTLTLFEAPADEVQAQLERRQGSIAIAALPIGPQFSHRVLARGSLHMLSNRKGNHKTRFHIEDLDQESVLLMRRGTLSHSIFQSAAQIAHIQPRIIYESSSPHALAALARAGIGTAILPFTARTNTRGLQCLPLVVAGKELRGEIAAIWRSDTFLSPQLLKLIDLVAKRIVDAPFLSAASDR